MTAHTGLEAREVDAFLALRRSWSGTREASGGLSALAGFDFQLARALATVIAQEARGKGATYVEVLSDIVEHYDGFLVAQAKRTLSSSAFRSALDELWSIYSLAVAVAPDMLPRLRFLVLSARRTLADWQGSLSRWSPVGADADQIADFRGRVSVSVEPTPRLEAIKLLVEEFKDQEPASRFDRVMGRLLGATSASMDDVVAEFRLELQGLRNAAAYADRRFGVWGASDRPPDEVVLEEDERLAVRIGERLTIADLREGRLAVRSTYDGIERRCEDWLEGEPLLYKLPVFWLSGRSGCGKSAALLNAASRLHAQDPDRLVLWLGNQVEWMVGAVRWAAEALRAGRTVVLVLDDPFTAERQQSFAAASADAQAEWEAIDDGSGAMRPPSILCCGPTEQRGAAEDACGGHLRFDGFEMPIESPGDFEELAAWYVRRTGRAVDPMGGNVLLVQQVFEWTKGAIDDFASRFRDRMRAMDGGVANGAVFTAVAEILALNRLYVDYPSSLLDDLRGKDPDLGAALIQLGEEEAHFDFGAGEGGSVRLTHPHLADSIYRSWFSRAADRPRRKAHLAAGLEAALGRKEESPEARHAPLWAIARLAQPRGRGGRESDPAMIARIDLIRTELAEVLSDLFARRFMARARPFEDFPVWVALDDELDLKLAPDPAATLAAVVATAVEPARGLRLSCHRLLAVEGGPPVVAVDAVSSCLTALAGWRGPSPWHDWAPVALDFVARCGVGRLLGPVADLAKSAPRLRGMSHLMSVLAQGDEGAARPIVVDWLQRTPDDELGWGSVLLSLISAHGHSEATDALAQRFLAGSPEDPLWPLVWHSLFEAERGDAALLGALGSEWLGLPLADGPPGLRFDERGWDRVWGPLVDRAVVSEDLPTLSQLLEAGRLWVDDADPDRDPWTRIWPELWRHETDAEGRRALAALAAEKLAVARPELLGWSLVWGPAAETGDLAVRERLKQIGLAWLKAVDAGHLGWVYVFQQLMPLFASAERDELVRLGVEWLRGGGATHRGWTHVWKVLVDSACTHEERDEIRRQGIDWLAGAELDHPGWTWIAVALLEAGGEIARSARPTIAAWLRDCVDQPGWRAVADAWREHGASPQERAVLVRICLRALDDQETPASSWPRLWHAARLAGCDRKVLVDYAEAFVIREDAEVSLRVGVCSRALALAARLRGSERLEAAGLSLIAVRSDRRSWASLWEELTQVATAAGKAILVTHASEWLVEVGCEHPDWSRVYLRASFIDSRVAERAPVQACAAEWLRLHPGSDKWIKAWRVQPARDRLLRNGGLIDVAMRALRSLPDEGAWSHLWRATASMAPGEAATELRRMALDWLPAHRSVHGFGPVWRDLVASSSDPAEKAELVQSGLDTLGALPPAADWFPVFTWFVDRERARLNRKDVLEAADEWLAAGGRGEGWTRVMGWRERLAPSPWRLKAVRDRARTWLTTASPTNRSWSFVWRNALDYSLADEREGLRDVSLGWLAQAPQDHVGWPYVWSSAWRLGRGDATVIRTLRSLGERWLARRVDHPAVRLVLRELRPNRQKRKTPGVAAEGR